MMPSEHPQEEMKLRELLKQMDAASTPVDEVLLQKLAAQTEAIFTSPTVTPVQTETKAMQSSIRWLMALAALVLLAVGIYFISNFGGPVPGLGKGPQPVAMKFEPNGTLETLLTNLSQQNVHLKVERDGQSSELWLADQGRNVRLNQADGTSRLISGKRSYFIDEAKNIAKEEVVSAESLNRLFSVPKQVSTNIKFEKNQAIELAEGKKAYRISHENQQIEAVVSSDNMLEKLTMGGVVLSVLNYNPEMPANLFQIKETLSEDGRVGKVLDVQGFVSVRPVGKQRWTPLGNGDLLFPGDLVRSDTRGPNAVRIRLQPNNDVTFGPGSMVEVTKPDDLRMQAGEAEVVMRTGSINLKSGQGETQKIEKTGIFRSTENTLSKLTTEPQWLGGFKGTIVSESLGSLLAKVDGRNVPLTVGYHKVDVDMRDGIARTTIEESFINRTNDVLEGTFYFPLPSDASIAGFGMWIGNEYVEADIVEKQRAREIFETILREKRDPGLLEWVGGNLFKTRVYPIPAHGEKRIKLVYTQVLPLQGSTFRYAYALQSDMLQQNPLRELSITFNVSSELAMKKVTSSSHACREEFTEKSARLTFTAQEHTPKKDFEAVIELAQQPSNITVLPHRRGEDGYFLVRLTPPATQGSWERQLVRDGKPLCLLILADTSASIDKKQREAQAQAVASLLQCLSPNDQFNLAAFDVTADWTFATPVQATPANVEKALEALRGRRSLGWTDLDLAITALSKQKHLCTNPVQAVYLGDGTPATAMGNEPQALLDRINSLLNRQQLPPIHSIALASSYEPMTLKAFASKTGGSFRRITADRTAAQVARDVLIEATDPNLLRDMKVTFEGVKTAKVYPEAIPNLSAGTETILNGRYLPTNEPQAGKIIITGSMGEQSVCYQAAFNLPVADAGNSFLPRLWAREHIEALLLQGGAAGREEIIGLSEEYHLMTPYTSLLVLESDADRARFAVKRRVNMRDGERFFADGKEKQELDLKTKQMQLARSWRKGLYDQAVRGFQNYGRVSVPNRNPRQNYRLRGAWRSESTSLGLSLYERGESEIYDNSVSMGDDFGGFSTNGQMAGLPMGGGGFGGGGYSDNLFGVQGPGGSGGIGGRSGGNGFLIYEGSESFGDMDGYVRLDGLADGKDGGWSREWNKQDESDYLDRGVRDLGEEEIVRALGRVHSFDKSSLMAHPRYSNDFDSEFAMEAMAGEPNLYAIQDKMAFLTDSRAKFIGGQYYYPQRGNPFDWSRLFVTIQATSPKLQPKVKTTWPQETINLVKSLHREARLRDALKTQALVWEKKATNYTPETKTITSQSIEKLLHNGTDWFTQTSNDSNTTVSQYKLGKERGSIHHAFQTGAVRTATPADGKQLPFSLSDGSLTDFLNNYQHYDVKVEKVAANQLQLTFTYKQKNYPHSNRLLIDTDKKVVLRSEALHNEKIASYEVHTDFIQAGNQWWATRSQFFNEKEQLTLEQTSTIQFMDQQAVATRIQTELAVRKNLFEVKLPLPVDYEAKRRFHTNAATAQDHFTLLLEAMRQGQYAKAKTHLEALRKLENKPALRWLQFQMLAHGRDQETLRQKLPLVIADKTLMPPSGNTYFLQEHLWQLISYFTPRERLALWEQLRVAALQRPDWQHPKKTDLLHRISLMDELGRTLEGNQLREEIFRFYPDDEAIIASSIHYYLHREQEVKAFALAEKLYARQPYQVHQCIDHELRQGRGANALAMASSIMKRDPKDYQLYTYYFHALLATGQRAEAEATLMRWLTEPTLTPDVSEAQQARIQAAIQMLTQRNNHPVGNIHDVKWHPILVKFFRHRLQSEKYYGGELHLLGSIQEEFLEPLRAEKLEEFPHLLATAPLSVVRNHYTLLAGYKATEERNKKWVEAILTRYQQETEPNSKFQWAYFAYELMPQSDKLAFLRKMRKEMPPENRAQWITNLYQALQNETPTVETLKELVDLLPELVLINRPDVEAKYIAYVPLTQLVDQWEAKYAQHQWNILEKKETLSRTAVQQKQQEFAKQAKQKVLKTLRETAATSKLGELLTLEDYVLQAKLNENRGELVKALWAKVEESPVKPLPENLELETEEEIASLRKLLFQQFLRDRHLAILTGLAVQKAATPKEIAKLLRYLEASHTAEPKHGNWRHIHFQLLTALDRPKDLEAKLQTWAEEQNASPFWYLQLAYSFAERGKLSEAIVIMDRLKSWELASSTDLERLADWKLALGQKEESKTLATDKYEVMNDQQLAYRFEMLRRQGTITQEMIDVAARMLKKSTQPIHHFHSVQNVYRGTKDFRLYAVLVEGMTGHSHASIYELLTQFSYLNNEIHEEATFDEIFKQINTLRPTLKGATDLRALDLLELMALQRVAQVKNQPGQYAEKMLQKLTAAMAHKFEPGEPAEFAKLLGKLSLGSQPLAQATILELFAKLQTMATAGTQDSIDITFARFDVLMQYGKHEEGLALLDRELAAIAAANQGKLLAIADAVYSRKIHHLRDTNREQEAENFILQTEGKVITRHQRRILENEYTTVIQHALKRGAVLSLGGELKLFEAAHDRLLGLISKENEQHQLAHHQRQLAENYGIATSMNLDVKGVREHARNFATKQLPALLANMAYGRRELLQVWTSRFITTIDVDFAMDFILKELDREKDWPIVYNEQHQSGWNQYASLLASIRPQLNSEPLKEKLLQYVLKILTSEMTQNPKDSYQRFIYGKGNNHNNHPYWQEKEAIFIATAMALGRQDLLKYDRVGMVVNYVGRDLGDYKSAITLLLESNNRKKAPSHLRYNLVEMMMMVNRHEEALAFCKELLAEQPNEWTYHSWQVSLLHKLNRQAELKAAFAATEKHFQKVGGDVNRLWNIAQLAFAVDLHADSVRLYDQVIPMYRQVRNNLIQNDNNYSVMHQEYARSLIAIGRVGDAIEAASTALVTWGARHDHRNQALTNLKSMVEAAAPKIDEVIAHLDARAKADGQDRPLLRRMVAEVLLSKNQAAKALIQLKLVTELEPESAETYGLLVRAYDAVGDKKAAMAASFEKAVLEKRVIQNWEDLGWRMTMLNDPSQAERAYTSMVELLPGEGESHKAMATKRQAQNRWGDAILHWKQVAELRKEEPTGLIGLVQAQLHEKQYDAAKEAIQKLENPAKAWDKRFESELKVLPGLKKQAEERRKPT